MGASAARWSWTRLRPGRFVSSMITATAATCAFDCFTSSHAAHKVPAHEHMRDSNCVYAETEPEGTQSSIDPIRFDPHPLNHGIRYGVLYL